VSAGLTEGNCQLEFRYPFGGVRVCTVKDGSVPGRVGSQRLVGALERDNVLRGLAQHDEAPTKRVSPRTRSGAVDETDQCWSPRRGRGQNVEVVERRGV
jgi:hypothetical protein